MKRRYEKERSGLSLPLPSAGFPAATCRPYTFRQEHTTWRTGRQGDEGEENIFMNLVEKPERSGYTQGMAKKEPRKNPAAVSLGRKGGSANTEAQNAARRENGKKGGRPKGKRE